MHTPKHTYKVIICHTNINRNHKELTTIFDGPEDIWNNLRKHQDPPPRL